MKREFLSRAWLLNHKLPTLPTSGPKELNILFSFSPLKKKKNKQKIEKQKNQTTTMTTTKQIYTPKS